MSVYGTGTYITIAAFLDSVDSPTSLLFFTPCRFISSSQIFYGRTTLRFAEFFHSSVRLSSCVPTVLNICSAGISTSCPSTTALALVLGPDLPRVDQLDPGNLRHSAYMILTYISLLIPAFSLAIRPRSLPLSLRPLAMLLYHAIIILHFKLRWCI